MKNSKLFLKIPETAQNFSTETWISQKFPNPSDFPAQTKNSQFGILKSQFGYPASSSLGSLSATVRRFVALRAKH